MKKINAFLATLFSCLVMLPSSARAIQIELEPGNAQRAVGGKVRVHVYATEASDLISMGIKVSYDESVLRVVDAGKFEENAATGWVIDDGEKNEYRTPLVDTSTPGEVTMIGPGVPKRATMPFSGYKARCVFDRHNIVNDQDLRLAVKRQSEYLDSLEGHNRQSRT